MFTTDDMWNACGVAQTSFPRKEAWEAAGFESSGASPDEMAEFMEEWLRPVSDYLSETVEKIPCNGSCGETYRHAQFCRKPALVTKGWEVHLEGVFSGFVPLKTP